MKEPKLSELKIDPKGTSRFVAKWRQPDRSKSR